MRRREGGEILFGERVVHAAAGDDQRAPRRLEQAHRLVGLGAIGSGTRDRPYDWLEETGWELERFGLHILR